MDKTFLKAIKFHTWAALLAAAFMGTSLCFLVVGITKNMTFTETDFTSWISLPYFILLFIAFAAAIMALVVTVGNPYPVYAALFLLSFLCACVLALIVGSESYSSSKEVNIGFLVGIGLFMIIIIKYLMADDKLMLKNITQADFFASYKYTYMLTGCAVLLFVIIISWVTIHRYLTFASAAFDFGLFAQMFEQMKTTGLPITTIERGEALSHFAVHFSPTWYLLLPGYMIFSSPIYLYVMNAVLIGFGAFPMYRIAKKLGISPLCSFSFALIYLLFPSMSAGTLWEIHENSFLPVLLLYMVYFFMEQKTVPMLIFAILTLGTKEDAAIYIVAFGLYALFATKQKRTGTLLIGISVLYFLIALKILNEYGDGAMLSRYANYDMDDMTGFGAILKTCIVNIGYVIKESFSFTDGKLSFILWMLVPVLFAPFLAKKNSLLFLLIPMLFINLMSSWSYQYDVYYQYTYGPAAFILLASIIAFAGWSSRDKAFYTVTALVISAIFSGALFWSKGAVYIDRYNTDKQNFKDSAAAIEEFLEDYYQEGDSVTAQGFLTSHLSEVDELYTLPAQYSENKETDWYLIHEGYQDEENYPTEMLEGYECVNPDASGFVRIYKKK